MLRNLPAMENRIQETYRTNLQGKVSEGVEEDGSMDGHSCEKALTHTGLLSLCAA